MRRNILSLSLLLATAGLPMLVRADAPPATSQSAPDLQAENATLRRQLADLQKHADGLERQLDELRRQQQQQQPLPMLPRLRIVPLPKPPKFDFGPGLREYRIVPSIPAPPTPGPLVPALPTVPPPTMPPGSHVVPFNGSEYYLVPLSEPAGDPAPASPAH